MISTEIKSESSTPTESSEERQEIDSTSECVIIDLTGQNNHNFEENIVNSIFHNANQNRSCQINEFEFQDRSHQVMAQAENQGTNRRIKLACACTMIWVSICLAGGALFYKFYLN